MPKLFVDVRYDLGYASGWLSWPVRSIFKVKRTTKRAYPLFRRFSWAIANHFLGDSDSYVKNAKNFYWRPLRPWLCIRLSLTASLAHFQGQTNSKALIPPLRWFLCAIANHFLGNPDFDVKNFKKLCGRLLRPWLRIRLASRPIGPILKVKEPEACAPPI